MCGIFGWQFRPNFKPPLAKRAVLAAALGRENVSRGKDSWGWYAADTNDICHGIGSIAGHTAGMAMSHSLIGHTRHGTTGAVTLANAHPYEINGIVGAHNGTIGNHKDLNDLRTATGLDTYEVDSMHLIDAISHNLDECMGIVGYGSVEWVELRDRSTIKLCRMTSSGDLRMFMCKEGIIWSSTKSALETAVAEAEFRGFMFDEPRESLIINLRNGVIGYSREKLLIGEYNKGYGSYGSQASSYGGRGMALIEEYRKAQIEKGADKREERKKKKALGSASDSITDHTKSHEVKTLCRSCYNAVGTDGKCSMGHDCSGQTALVLNM